jgi:tRNA threonylcarbamoyladenosine biosynthesis protein TsaB
VQPRLLILETSCFVGQVALAQGEHVLGRRPLDEARRHARDLIPALRELLDKEGWKARDLDAVIVSRGPGSYTGLRVGLMTAKTLAFAIGCGVLAIETFAAVAVQAPEEALRLEVLADAQQDRIYVQGFVRAEAGQAWEVHSELAIRPFADWLGNVPAEVWISGPGVSGKESRLTGRRLVDASRREPLPESLLRLGLERHRAGQSDDLWNLEPLYLRPSAAEEKWSQKA